VMDTLRGCAWEDSVRIRVNRLGQNFEIVPGDTSLCYGDSLLFGTNLLGSHYLWSNGDTGAVSRPVWTATGDLWVQMDIAWGNGFCPVFDTIEVVVDSLPLTAQMVTGYGPLCLGESVQLLASGALQYLWSPSASLNNATLSSPVGSPLVSTTYVVEMWNSGACVVRDSVLIVVDTTTPNGTLSVSDSVVCLGDSILLSASGGTSYSWTATAGGNFVGLGNVATQWAVPTGASTYYVQVADGGVCRWRDSVNVVDENCCHVPGAVTLFSPRASNWAQPLAGGSFHIVDTFYVDTTLSFVNTTFWMDSAAVIYVNNGATFRLSNSTLKAACGQMWEGIVLESAGEKLVSKSNLFRDALRAVNARLGADFEIGGSIFRANNVGILVDSAQGVAVHPGSVTGSRFEGGSMLPPFAGAYAPYAGIWVRESRGLHLGSAAGTAKNVFVGLEHGILARNASVWVENNVFRDILPQPLPQPSGQARGSGAAIYANASAAVMNFDPRLVVGLENGFSGPDLAAAQNRFVNCYMGVHVRNGMDVRIRGNVMDSLTGYGVFVQRQRGDSVWVEKNTLEQCPVGMSFGSMRGVRVLISGNVITGDSAVRRHGIRLDMVHYPGLSNNLSGFVVKGNDIFLRGNGVWLLNTDHVSVEGNYVKVYLPVGGSPAGTLNGLYVAAATGPNRLMNNKLRSDVRTWQQGVVKARGIYVEGSPETEVRCNEVQSWGRGIVWRSFSEPSGLYKNLLMEAWDGLVLRDKGRVGRQGRSTPLPAIPSDNSWQGGNFGHSQTLSISSDASFSELFTRVGANYNPNVNLAVGNPQIPFTTTTIPATNLLPVVCGKRATGGQVIFSIKDIVGNRLSSGPYQMATQFLMDAWAFQALFRDSTLLEGEPDLLEFFDLNEDEDIGTIVKIQEALIAEDEDLVSDLLAA
ncbi:MAG TPA: hypothetical protein ENJ82_17620, partial [Bacteroidetes bacterium]|nr:hypothetical protein [Bacteroidota bacterium]